ncbi:MAG: hypothetical protein RLZZ292_2567 [Bacteroidota bacterium]|jgi:uncharacterized membrane protein YfcA
MQHYELLLFFFAIAAIYASVGFGGGSSYIAVLALYGLGVKEVKLTALICNIIVVSGGLWLFVQHQQLNWRKSLPWVIASVPMTFLGATMKISEHVYFILLGCTLIIAGILLWLDNRAQDASIANTIDNQQSTNNNSTLFYSLLGGGSIGLLSGMVGLGGGVFLSPILNLRHWDTSKRIAATASLFIFANSIAGIAGQYSTRPDTLNYMQILCLGGAVLFGGQLGSRWSIYQFNLLTIKRLTALLVLFAAGEILWKHLFNAI